MIDFPEYNLENMGGLSTFNIVPSYSASPLPYYLGSKLTQPVVLKAGAMWTKGVSLLKSLKFEESTKETDAGTLYEYTIGGIYPGNSPEVAELFDEMKNKTFLLDIIDNNNQRRLIGTPSNPVKFKFVFSTKDQPSGRPEYSFTFTNSTPIQAPFYILD